MDPTRSGIDRRTFLASAAAAAAMSQLPLASGLARAAGEAPAVAGFQPVKIPDWVFDVTSMAFGSGGDLELMESAGIQVLHTNLIWPYFPLRRDGGGLTPADAAKMKELVTACEKHHIRLVLGLPPFPNVDLVKKHPDWRVQDESTGKILKVAPDENNLGTRVGCNVGPWGDYLIEICGELIEDFGFYGYSFDGNYHPALCFCPACRAAYQADRKKPLPAAVNLDDPEYRRYLAWRGERLEDHYRRLQQRIKRARPDAVLMSWTVNAGRYGHLLYSPRAMPTRMNLLFDLPMQEWWLDETNFGASVAAAFGAAYLHATTSGRPCASESYLMSRGNPYGTYSFPAHEHLCRALLAVSHGNMSAQSFGWSGHRESTKNVCLEVKRRAPWITRAEPIRWAGMLVSEQTRQFYAYKNIAELFLPHVLGAFRAGIEEHLPLRPLNDWDLAPEELAKYKVVLLPNAAALSASQVEAVREYVRSGGGLVATGESSLCDELGEAHADFALADMFGVSFRGRPHSSAQGVKLDENFARTLDANYWKERVGVAMLSWTDHALVEGAGLAELVPEKRVIFRGPQVLVSEPADKTEIAWRLQPEGEGATNSPGAIARKFGKGKVVYMASALDAALWSYSFPYQRKLLAHALQWAASAGPEHHVTAPMCVQSTFFRQTHEGRSRTIVHLYNNVNSSGQHGLPSAEVPLREESVPIAGIRVTFLGEQPKHCRLQPDDVELPLRKSGAHPGKSEVELPPLALHSMVVAEF